MKRILVLLAVPTLFLGSSFAQIQQSGAVVTPSATQSILGGVNVAMTNATCNVLTPGSACTLSGISQSYLVSYYLTYNITSATSAQNLVVPLQPGAEHWVNNTSAFVITAGGTTGTTVAVQPGTDVLIHCPDGGNYVQSTVIGMGTSGTIPLWSSTSALGNSPLSVSNTPTTNGTFAMGTLYGQDVCWHYESGNTPLTACLRYAGHGNYYGPYTTNNGTTFTPTAFSVGQLNIGQAGATGVNGQAQAPSIFFYENDTVATGPVAPVMGTIAMYQAQPTGACPNAGVSGAVPVWGFAPDKTQSFCTNAASSTWSLFSANSYFTGTPTVMVSGTPTNGQSLIATSSTAGSFGSIGNYVQKFQLGPRVGIQAFNATGDSITAGTGASCITCGGALDPANTYVSQMGVKIGVTPNNLGVSGAQSEDWVRNVIFPSINPTPYNNPLLTALILHNDVHWCPAANSGPTTGCLANAESSMLAGLTWTTIPITDKVLANAPSSCSGTWTADTTVIPSGLMSIVPSASCTYSFGTTQPNQAIYIWYRGQDSNTSTGSINIDSGSITDTISSAPTSGQCICTILGGTQTVWGKRYVIPNAGSHTLIDIVTAASAGNNLLFLGIGVAPVAQEPSIGPPSIFLGSPIYENSFANQASTDAFTAQLAAQVAQLQSDGLLIGYTNSNLYMVNSFYMSGSNVTVPNGLGDNNSGTVCSATQNTTVGQHPNTCGHGHLRDMFLSMIQPAAPPPQLSFPSPVSTIDALTSTTGKSTTTSQINGGLNYYTAGTGTPGITAGTAFFQPSSGVFTVSDFQPSNFAGRAFCYYAVSTTITTWSQLTCPVLFPQKPSSNSGAITIGNDSIGQGIVMSVVSGTSYAYPIVYGQVNTSNAAGLFVHRTSGVADQVGFMTSNGSPHYPIVASANAASNSLLINADSTIYSAFATPPTGACSFTGAFAIDSTGNVTICNFGTYARPAISAASLNASGTIASNTMSSVLTGTTPSTAPICPNGSGGTFTTSGCATSSGLSGMTAGQFPVAATSTTVTGSVGSTGTGTVVLSASPALTGTPTAPTATVGTNTTQVATTAFVLANGGGGGSVIISPTTVSCTTSGSVTVTGTSISTYDKEILILLNSCSGGVTINYPAFTHTPSLFAPYQDGSAIPCVGANVGSISTTSATIIFAGAGACAPGPSSNAIYAIKGW